MRLSLAQLWDEIIQEQGIFSEGKSIETRLKFPRKINIEGKFYDEVKVKTIRKDDRYRNELYVCNSEEWKHIKSFEPRKEEMCQMHSDKLTGLRGEYVKQHRYDS